MVSMKKLSFKIESMFKRSPLGVQPITLSLFAALVLTGCVPGDLGTSSVVSVPESLEASRVIEGINVSKAKWPQEKWWHAFGDDQLDELVNEALTSSPTLRAASARVRQANALEGMMQAQQFPRLDANIANTRQRYSENGTTPAVMAGTWQTVNQDTLNVSYELDFWGKNRAAVEAALGRIRAMEVDRYATQLMLSSAIVQTYIGLDENFRQLAIEQEMLIQQLKVLELTQQRFSAELDSQIDIRQSQAAIPATRARIAALKESQELSRNKLAALLGKGPDRGRAISAPHIKPFGTVSIPSALPAELLGHRPDVVVQRWRVEAASHDIEGARARFYPNINLVAYAGYQSLGFDQLSSVSSRIFGIGPAISLPIFEGGRLRANLAAQNAAYDIAVENYNQTLVDALHDISDQLSSLRWLRERIELQQQAVETADDAAKLVAQRYVAGLATYIQVLTTDNEALLQHRQLALLQSRGLALEASLSRALGGGYVPSLSVEVAHK